MNADGSVIIDVEMNVEDAEKEYSKLKTQIRRTTQAIEDMQKKKSPLVEQAEQLRQKMKAAQAQADAFGRDWQNGVVGADRQQTEALETVQRIRAEYDAVVAKIDKIDEKILPAVEHLERAKKEAGEMRQEIDKAAKSTAKNAKNTEKMSEATKKASKHAQSFASRMKSAFVRMATFGLMYKAYGALSDWLVKSVRANDEAAASIARFKGALLTMVQPILNVVIPAFSSLVDVATKVIAVFARLIAAVFGTTVEESANAAENLYNEQNALEGVGDAAKKASKQLAAFDEINKLTGDTAETTTGKDVTSPIIPDFTAIKNVKLPEWLEKIVSDLEIGISKIRFGISNGFSAGDENDLDFGKTVSQLLKEFLVGVVTFKSLKGGLLTVGAGLILKLFNSSFKEDTEEGHSGASEFETVVGNILKTIIGVGVYKSFGGGVLGIALGLTAAFSSASFISEFMGNDAEGQDGGIWGVLDGIFDAVLTASVFKGIIKGGTKGTVVSLALGLGIEFIYPTIKDVVSGNYVSNAQLAISSLLTGILSAVLVSTFFGGGWALALATGLVTMTLTLAVSFAKVNFDEDAKWERTKALIDEQKEAQEKKYQEFFGENSTITLEDKTPSPGQISGGTGLPAFSSTWGTTAPKTTIEQTTKITTGSLQIPRLASGSVIPPNREFLAVLGDQKSGTNIEAPLDTIVQAMQIALGNSGGGRNEAVLEVDGTVFGRLAYKYADRERKRIGVSLAGGNA